MRAPHSVFYNWHFIFIFPLWILLPTYTEMAWINGRIQCKYHEWMNQIIKSAAHSSLSDFHISFFSLFSPVSFVLFSFMRLTNLSMRFFSFCFLFDQFFMFVFDINNNICLLFFSLFLFSQMMQTVTIRAVHEINCNPQNQMNGRRICIW